jgi:hypothetical protein
MLLAKKAHPIEKLPRALARGLEPEAEILVFALERRHELG